MLNISDLKTTKKISDDEGEASEVLAEHETLDDFEKHKLHGEFDEIDEYRTYGDSESYGEYFFYETYDEEEDNDELEEIAPLPPSLKSRVPCYGFTRRYPFLDKDGRQNRLAAIHDQVVRERVSYETVRDEYIHLHRELDLSSDPCPPAYRPPLRPGMFDLAERRTIFVDQQVIDASFAQVRGLTGKSKVACEMLSCCYGSAEAFTAEYRFANLEHRLEAKVRHIAIPDDKQHEYIWFCDYRLRQKRNRLVDQANSYRRRLARLTQDRRTPKQVKQSLTRIDPRKVAWAWLAKKMHTLLRPGVRATDENLAHTYRWITGDAISKDTFRRRRDQYERHLTGSKVDMPPSEA